MEVYDFVIAQAEMLKSLEYGYRYVLESVISGLYNLARDSANAMREVESRSGSPEAFTNWIAVIANAPDDKLESSCLDGLVFALSSYIVNKEDDNE